MLAYFAWDSYLEVGSSRKCLRLAELTGTIDNIDETLTMSVQMAAVTGDKKWEERYLNFEPKLNSTIKEALEVGKELRMATAVAKVHAANSKLLSMENRAFDLIHAGQGKAAYSLLNGAEYESEKNVYRKGIDQISDQINVFVNRKDDASYLKSCLLIAFVLLALPALIVSMIVIFVMIKRYEIELRKSECRFLELSEVSNAWIWELDSKMRFTYSNHMIRKFLGYHPGEIIGKTPADLVTPSKMLIFMPIINDAMDNPKPFLEPKRELSHKDGTSRTVRVNGIPLYDHNDEFNGYRGICHDIT